MNGTKRELPNTIGGRIQKLRVEANFTQGELAKIMGVKRETVNQWESETRDLKTAYTIKLANHFNVTCDYILRGVKAENVDIHERTGLSDRAIENLSQYDYSKKQTLSNLIENDKFRKVLNTINVILLQNDLYARYVSGLVNEINDSTEDTIRKVLFDIGGLESLGYEVHNYCDIKNKRTIDIKEYISSLRYKLIKNFETMVDELTGLRELDDDIFKILLGRITLGDDTKLNNLKVNLLKSGENGELQKSLSNMLSEFVHQKSSENGGIYIPGKDEKPEEVEELEQ